MEPNVQHFDNSSTDNNHPHLSGSMQIILWFASFIFALVSDQAQSIGLAETMGFVWTWVFRMLSLFSLILIIAINYDKGMERIKGAFRKKKK